jgi:hypothetical protein
LTRIDRPVTDPSESIGGHGGAPDSARRPGRELVVPVWSLRTHSPHTLLTLSTLTHSPHTLSTHSLRTPEPGCRRGRLVIGLPCRPSSPSLYQEGISSAPCGTRRVGETGRQPLRLTLTRMVSLVYPMMVSLVWRRCARRTCRWALRSAPRPSGAPAAKE